MFEVSRSDSEKTPSEQLRMYTGLMNQAHPTTGAMLRAADYIDALERWVASAASMLPRGCSLIDEAYLHFGIDSSNVSEHVRRSKTDEQP